MKTPRYPSLYQINTRVWLAEISNHLGRPATLDDIPDEELDRLARMGFDWIWFLSVWQTGSEARAVSRSNPEWRREFRETLPDLRDEDIPGSGFAITGYVVHNRLGGDIALARLRDRLKARGMKLMLDFVPNHMGLGHPWIEEHPEYFVGGTELDLARTPQNYIRLSCQGTERIFAHGRDPYFPGWPDVLQLNYGNSATQEAMIEELKLIAGQCDGVRCDMAMLVLPEVFERTWGIKSEPFWPRAIEQVRHLFPAFCFMGEVYWELEWTVQQQGFDYAYDKRLYDRLREGHARPVREHLFAGLDYQDKLTRFLENHDEPRAAATFPVDMHQAAAAVTFLSPGLRFFHQGQFEGKLKRISPHLGRGPQEPVEQKLREFYERLQAVLRHPVVRDGEWQLLECSAAWDGNWTSDCFIAFAWQSPDPDGERLLVAVNYAPNRSQCFVRLPYLGLGCRNWRLQDLIGQSQYDRAGAELTERGLYLDEGPWFASVFLLTELAAHPPESATRDGKHVDERNTESDGHRHRKQSDGHKDVDQVVHRHRASFIRSIRHPSVR